ncbi:alpha-ribazole phosphatase [Chitinophaga skermanii]|uniref:Alpha-ribazole phosphatase n=1 Tax=Chitinophaga skermanii TaxID=331697 RepID=A0A327R3A7_9BACT|nr:alpha-ribazole phosphatase [Chitinophaga skermanii]RAJ10538.1 alpha-ribazole phosphatase [Chitinophaga skermanii]
MEIYLIRHTTPRVPTGTCYGVTDLDVADSFLEESAMIKKLLPNQLFKIYTSPLQRCAKLATHIFDQPLITDKRLVELDFGEWEMRAWDDISPQEMEPWMQDWVTQSPPGGESYQALYNRTVDIFQEVMSRNEDAIIIAHGGVIRAIIAYVQQIPLKDSFQMKLPYGGIIRLQFERGKVDILPIFPKE